MFNKPPKKIVILRHEALELEKNLTPAERRKRVIWAVIFFTIIILLIGLMIVGVYFVLTRDNGLPWGVVMILLGSSATVLLFKILEKRGLKPQCETEWGKKNGWKPETLRLYEEVDPLEHPDDPRVKETLVAMKRETRLMVTLTLVFSVVVVVMFFVSQYAIRRNAEIERQKMMKELAPEQRQKIGEYERTHRSK